MLTMAMVIGPFLVHPTFFLAAYQVLVAIDTTKAEQVEKD